MLVFLELVTFHRALPFAIAAQPGGRPPGPPVLPFAPLSAPQASGAVPLAERARERKRRQPTERGAREWPGLTLHLTQPKPCNNSSAPRAMALSTPSFWAFLLLPTRTGVVETPSWGVEGWKWYMLIIFTVARSSTAPPQRPPPPPL